VQPSTGAVPISRNLSAPLKHVAQTPKSSSTEFEEHHARIHQIQFKQSILTNKEAHIKLINPEVAIVHIEWVITGDKDPDGTTATSVRT
jgi:hypothetical protein